MVTKQAVSFKLNGKPVDVLVSGLRCALAAAEGKVFGAGDFSMIEACVLLALAGCGRSFFQGERAAWRHEAEVTCLKSGAVKLGAGVVQMQPIEGPGMCGADFPLKVALLGESAAMSYADDLRPPEAIPNASPAQPRWPASEPRYTPPAPMQSAPIQSGNMRWVPGPPGIERPEADAPARYAPVDEPPAAAGRPMSIYAPGVAAPDDIPDDAVLPPGRGRGSSVGSLVCYLTGLSHVDPVAANLSLGRFLNRELSSVPDIDLDFPRDIREQLIVRERMMSDEPATLQKLGDILGVSKERVRQLEERARGKLRVELESLREDAVALGVAEPLEHQDPAAFTANIAVS